MGVKTLKDNTLGAYNIADLREMARRRLPKGIFEFVDRGAEDEVSLRNNRAAFERIKLMPRVLVDVSQRSQEITLFGQRQKMPIAIAPTGAAGIMWHEGEIAVARAAAAAGIPFTLATGSMTAMEKVVAQAGGRLWFQLYMYADRSLSHQIAERAKAAGFEALIVTVDSPVFSNREYNLRNNFTMPMSYTVRNVTDVLTHPRWLAGVLMRYLLTTGMPRYENYPSEVKARITAQPMGRALKLNDSLTWDDVRVLRKLWPRTLMVKGLLHPQDAVFAADCGADVVTIQCNWFCDPSEEAVFLAPLEIVSGVRPAGGYTRRESRHIAGEAVDFRIRGVPNTELRDFCRTYDHVGVGFQHDVLVDQAGAGDRWTAGVDGALDAVLAGPAHHLARRRPVLDAAEADLA